MGLGRMLGRKEAKKADIIRQQKMKEEFERNRLIARELIWPVVKKYATNAKHAENTLRIAQQVITIAMQKPYHKATVASLGIEAEITADEKAEDRDFHLDLFKALADSPIPETMKLLEGMAGAINGVTTKQAGEKPMAEITIDEIIK